MELIKVFTGMLLIICLFSCANVDKLKPIATAKEQLTNIQNRQILGLIVQDFKGRVRVKEVLDYSPARYAGIEEGDKIIEVEGVKIEDTKTFFENIENNQNKENIKLTIYRVDSCSKFPVEIKNYCKCSK